tara:strand:+ start:228 stop:404 length:177 start_codon:yes stop_codon:yes gene_type:complete
MYSSGMTWAETRDEEDEEEEEEEEDDDDDISCGIEPRSWRRRDARASRTRGGRRKVEG